MSEIREKDKEVPQNSLENKIRLVDIGREKINQEPVSREIKTWIEKVEEASSLNPTQINDDHGQPLLTPTTTPSPTVVLPITRQTFISGFKKTIADASRWLSVFFLRFIKMKKGQVTFKNQT